MKQNQEDVLLLYLTLQRLYRNLPENLHRQDRKINILPPIMILNTEINMV